MKKLLKHIADLESHIPQFEKSNLSVSKSTVGWHIEHSLMAIGKIISSLEKSNPQDYKWKFNFARIIVFHIGRIPRGKRKAPKTVQPEGKILVENLKANVRAVFRYE